MAIYRDREQPYPIPVDIEAWGTFTTNPPGVWIENAGLMARFVAIYGGEALIRVRTTKLVPENENKRWVYPTSWTGKIYLDKPDVELPRPTWEKPDFTGLSKGEEQILRGVNHIIELLETKK